MASETFHSIEIDRSSGSKRKFGIFPLRQTVAFRRKQEVINKMVDLADLENTEQVDTEYVELLAALKEADNPSLKLDAVVQLINEFDDTGLVDTVEIQPLVEEAAAEILETLEKQEDQQSRRYGGNERHYVGPGVGPRSALLAFEAYEALPCVETKELAAYSASHLASKDIRQVFQTAWTQSQQQDVSPISILQELRERQENTRPDAWKYEFLYDQNETASPNSNAA